MQTGSDDDGSTRNTNTSERRKNLEMISLDDLKVLLTREPRYAVSLHPQHISSLRRHRSRQQQKDLYKNSIENWPYLYFFWFCSIIRILLTISISILLGTSLYRSEVYYSYIMYALFSHAKTPESHLSKSFVSSGQLLCPMFAQALNVISLNFAPSKYFFDCSAFSYKTTLSAVP